MTGVQTCALPISGLVGTEEVRLANLNYATAITRASETRIRRSMEANRCN